MALQQTPRSDRLHIGIFGKRNSGKSTLLNALTGQSFAIVSPHAGTTTDPVYKSMEMHGIGPVVWIDTAGFDDPGELGSMRVNKTEQAAQKVDIAILLFADASTDEQIWFDKLKQAKTPIIPVLNKTDALQNTDELSKKIEKLIGEPPIHISALNGDGIETIREALLRKLPEDYNASSLLEGLVEDGDTVLLVMPQDVQAPKGRLILPQVQTIRALLDKKCICIAVTADKVQNGLNALKSPPRIIITDSQVFGAVYDAKPEESLITSFSVLMARYKGDAAELAKGARQIDRLTVSSRVLIAEACTHVPLAEDIGREKIPGLLRKKIGANIKIDIVSGTDFPNDLTDYDLIIHCGACMFNKKLVMARISQAREQGVPITNYGMAIAFTEGILDKIVL